MMTGKRTYTQVVTSFETHIEYIREDIGKIELHLKELNGREGEQDIDITKNKTNIGWIVKIGSGIAFVILSLLAIAAGLVRIF